MKTLDNLNKLIHKQVYVKKKISVYVNEKSFREILSYKKFLWHTMITVFFINGSWGKLIIMVRDMQLVFASWKKNLYTVYIISGSSGRHHNYIVIHDNTLCLCPLLCVCVILKQNGNPICLSLNSFKSDLFSFDRINF